MPVSLTLRLQTSSQPLSLSLSLFLVIVLTNCLARTILANVNTGLRVADWRTDADTRSEKSRAIDRSISVSTTADNGAHAGFISGENAGRQVENDSKKFPQRIMNPRRPAARLARDVANRSFIRIPTALYGNSIGNISILAGIARPTGYRLAILVRSRFSRVAFPFSRGLLIVCRVISAMRDALVYFFNYSIAQHPQRTICETNTRCSHLFLSPVDK